MVNQHLASLTRFAALETHARELEREARESTGDDADDLLRDALATRVRMVQVARGDE